MASVECGNCTAACCRKDMGMALGEDEATFLMRAGTRLREILPPFEGSWEDVISRSHDISKLSTAMQDAIRATQAGQGYFVLETDCGWLTDDGLCGAHEDPERPEVCQKFEAGSIGCITLRLARGIETDLPIIDLSGEHAELNQQTIRLWAHAPLGI